MNQKLKRRGKSILSGQSTRSTNTGSYIRSKNEINVSINASGKSTNEEGIPPFHILSKRDIEKELFQIEKKFGMTPEELHKAWREGKIHGHMAMKLGCYYEFYKDEYE